MRKITLFIAVLFISPFVFSQNITNGNFEGGAEADGTPTGWLNVGGTSKITQVLSVESGEGVSGSNALKSLLEPVAGQNVENSDRGKRIRSSAFSFNNPANLDIVPTVTFSSNLSAGSDNDYAITLIYQPDGGSVVNTYKTDPLSNLKNNMTATSVNMATSGAGNLPASPTYTNVAVVFEVGRLTPDNVASAILFLDDVSIEFKDTNGNILLNTDKISFENNILSLFPQPAENKINIDTLKKVEKADVYSLLGAKIKSISGENIKTIDVSNLNSGIYILKLQSGNTIESKKFIKK